MDSGKVQQEYKKSLGKLSFLNTMIIHDKKEYIIYFQPNEGRGTCGTCRIQVTNGYEFWLETFDFDKFEQKRKGSGLEGTYCSYFDMMIKAVYHRNFEVSISPQQNFNLVLYFQLNKGVSLKGDFDLGQPVQFQDAKEFHMVYRTFLFDIFKAKDQERMRAEQQRKANRGRAPQQQQQQSGENEEGGDDENANESQPRKKRPQAGSEQ